MGNFIFTVGCPGSGKSTYADIKTHDGWQKLCLDDFRVALWGSKQNFWNAVDRGGTEAVDARETLKTVYDAAFNRLTATDSNVVVANCHLVHGEMEFLKVLERRHDARLVVFSTDLDTLLERNRTRPEDDRVGEEFLREQYERFVTKPGWWENYVGRVELRRA